jgi:hypothetical protein
MKTNIDVLLGPYTAEVANYIATFRDNLSVCPLRWDLWGCAETSAMILDLRCVGSLKNADLLFAVP